MYIVAVLNDCSNPFMKTQCSQSAGSNMLQLNGLYILSTKTLINIYRVPPQPSDAKPKKLFKRNRCHCAEAAYHGLLMKKSKQKSPAANLELIENQLLLV